MKHRRINNNLFWHVAMWWYFHAWPGIYINEDSTFHYLYLIFSLFIPFIFMQTPKVKTNMKINQEANNYSHCVTPVRWVIILCDHYEYYIRHQIVHCVSHLILAQRKSWPECKEQNTCQLKTIFRKKLDV